MVNYDYLFNDNKLYHRLKINEINKNELKVLCLYFKKNDSFFVSYFLDFLEVDITFDFEHFSKMLTKEIIEKNEIMELIKLFGNYKGNITKIELELISAEIASKGSINDLYFSIE